MKNSLRSTTLSGASGPISFEANLDRSTVGLSLTIQSFYVDLASSNPGGLALRSVGTMIGGAGLKLTAPITWRSGAVTDPAHPNYMATVPKDKTLEPLVCESGHIQSFLNSWAVCRPCEAGTYEYLFRVCEKASSRYYIPYPAANESDLIACPANMRFLKLERDRDADPATDPTGGLRMRPHEGATNQSQCVCDQGFFSTSEGACVACPEGGTCLGGSFMPIALPGFGLVRRSPHGLQGPVFFKCQNAGKCPTGEEGCDCLGGEIQVRDESLLGVQEVKLTSVVIDVYRCADGYSNGSALCAVCDGKSTSHDGTYAMAHGVCSRCTLPPASYILIALALVCTWYPLVRHIAMRVVPSIYTTLQFLQFIALYSSFDIPWTPALSTLFDALSVFNLDLDAIHFRCAGGDRGFDFADMWIVQMLIPVLYLVFCVVHLSQGLLFHELAKRALPPTGIMLSFGWRPRRDFSPNRLMQAYVSPGLFFLNMYFIGGISTSFKMLSCRDDGAGASFVRSAPSIQCWEGDHISLAAGAIVAVALYGGGLPLIYAWVLYRIVPKYGRNSSISRAYGFLYTRFEPDYWYHELVNLFRKLLFVVITIFVETPLNKSIFALGAITLALISQLLTHPYNNDIYDVLEEVLTFVQFLIVFLGVVLIASQSEAEAEAAADFSAPDIHKPDWAITLAWIAMCVALLLIVYVAMTDISSGALKRRAERLSHQLPKCALSPTVFNTAYEDGLLLDWLRQPEAWFLGGSLPALPLHLPVGRRKSVTSASHVDASSTGGGRVGAPSGAPIYTTATSDLDTFRALERDLLAALFDSELDNKDDETKDFERHIEVSPYMLDMLVADPNGNLPTADGGDVPVQTGSVSVDGMRAYFHGFRGASPFGGPPSIFLFSPTLRGALLRWLAAVERTRIRQLMHAFLSSLHLFGKQRQTSLTTRLFVVPEDKSASHAVALAREVTSRPVETSRHGKSEERMVQIAQMLMHKSCAKIVLDRDSAGKGLKQRLQLLNTYVHAERIVLVPLPNTAAVQLPYAELEFANDGSERESLHTNPNAVEARQRWARSLDSDSVASICLKRRAAVRVSNARDTTDPVNSEIDAAAHFTIDNISQLCIPVFANELPPRSWEVHTNAVRKFRRARSRDITQCEIVAVIKCFNKRSKVSSRAGFAFSENDEFLGSLVADLIVIHMQKLEDDVLSQKEHHAALLVQLHHRQASARKVKVIGPGRLRVTSL